MIVKESLSDFLKPKDTEEIIKAFKSQPIHQQVDFLEDRDDGELLSDNITFKDYPLIYQIKETMMNTTNFNQHFRLTAYDILWSGEQTNYIGQEFRIFKRDIFQKEDALYIRQFNDEPNTIHMDGSSINTIIKAKGFLDFINKLSEVFEIPIQLKKDLIHKYDMYMTNI